MAEHEGHRARIIQKLDSGTLLDHELLEVLLFNAIPRKNTNDLAHRLLAAFGSLHGIFAAPKAQLTEVDGVGESIASYLFCIGRIYECYSRLETGNEFFPKTFEAKDFMRFIARKYAKNAVEVLDFYFLDSSHRFIFCKRFSSGSVDGVTVSPDDLAHLLSVIKPDGMVAVHNHPKGNCLPSEADNMMTCQCQMICSIHNVRFYDHFIYSASGIYSYYMSGKMQEISKKYSIGTLGDN